MRALHIVIPALILVVSACGKNNSAAKSGDKPSERVEESQQQRWARENEKYIRELQEVAERARRGN